jgi:hypothetical protein
MGTRDRKARLAVLEKAHAPTAGLSYLQAQITNSKTSMSAIAWFRQLTKSANATWHSSYRFSSYCSFAYSALASFRMGMSGSASFLIGYFHGRRDASFLHSAKISLEINKTALDLDQLL